jgi:hypothetical protein
LRGTPHLAGAREDSSHEDAEKTQGNINEYFYDAEELADGSATRTAWGARHSEHGSRGLSFFASLARLPRRGSSREDALDHGADQVFKPDPAVRGYPTNIEFFNAQ